MIQCSNDHFSESTIHMIQCSNDHFSESTIHMIKCSIEEMIISQNKVLYHQMN